ncbi:hypothetical protein [Isorropodon fossajaponicum symbiont]|uniref:hypothetical protein n=1 Tax=Isorropodon fossajaponicum symbiont TaxID=883811 RepID=UPI001CED9705|nr:hypothetical protein [Isorropodon fossajaponicum symbiont]
MLEKYDEATFQLDYLATNSQWKKQFKRLKNALNYAQIFTQGELSIPSISTNSK